MVEETAEFLLSAPDLLREHNAMLEACLFTANVMEGILLYDTLEHAAGELCEVRERVEAALALVRGEGSDEHSRDGTTRDELAVGDLVQLYNTRPEFDGCIAVVDELKSFGAQVCIRSPAGFYYYRASHQQMRRVGRVADEVTELIMRLKA